MCIFISPTKKNKHLKKRHFNVEFPPAPDRKKKGDENYPQFIEGRLLLLL